MISRSGTRRSGAASGEAKIFRDEGSGPVVTAGTVLSGLERMFMGSSGLIRMCVRLGEGGEFLLRHCERSEAIQNLSAETVWIASSQVLLAMTTERLLYTTRCRAAARPASASSSLSRSSGLIKNPFMPASKQA